MNQQIIEKFEKFAVPGCFTKVEVTDQMIAQAQADLGVTLSQQYVEFLKAYGHGGFEGFEILGFSFDGVTPFVTTTLANRAKGLPANLVAIQDCEEWLDCIDCDNGQIVSWSEGDDGNAAFMLPDFDSFLMDLLQDLSECI